MQTTLTYVDPCFKGRAKLSKLDNGWVELRYSIQETWPETIIIKIREERWEKLGKPTELYIRVAND